MIFRFCAGNGNVAAAVCFVFLVLWLLKHVVKGRLDAMPEFFMKNIRFVIRILKTKGIFMHFPSALKASGITLGLTSAQTFRLVSFFPVSGPERQAKFVVDHSAVQWRGPK